MKKEEVYARLDAMAKRLMTLRKMAMETGNEYLLNQAIEIDSKMECASCMAHRATKLFDETEKQLNEIFNQMN